LFIFHGIKLQFCTQAGGQPGKYTVELYCQYNILHQLISIIAVYVWSDRPSCTGLLAIPRILLGRCSCAPGRSIHQPVTRRLSLHSEWDIFLSPCTKSAVGLDDTLLSPGEPFFFFFSPFSHFFHRQKNIFFPNVEPCWKSITACYLGGFFLVQRVLQK
jgi:hypothetical protein